MLKLFYSPGACSLVSHIALEETKTVYSAEVIHTAKGDQLTDRYLKINPYGRVPALETEQGVLAENIAILNYLSKIFPDAKLIPTDSWKESQALSLLSYFSSTVQVAFSHYGRPSRYSTDESSFAVIKQTGRDSFYSYCTKIDRLLSERQWLIGDFSVCDLYPFLFFRWGKHVQLPMEELKGMERHYRDMLSRSSVERALEQEGLKP